MWSIVYTKNLPRTFKKVQNLSFVLAAAAIASVVQNRALAQDEAARILDDSDTGDTTLSLNAYKQIDYKESGCNIDLEDLEGSPTRGKYQYSCRIIRLSHLREDGVIRKFNTLSCRNGNNPDKARFKAVANDQQLLFKMELDEATALGYPQGVFIMDREIQHCVRLPDDPNFDEGTSVSNNAPVPTDTNANSHPDSARFIIHNRDRYRLGVEFFSKTREGYLWPGNGREFILNKDDTYNLSCTVGERICFGAWRDNQVTSWGVGRRGTQGCTNCCTTCGDELETTIGDGGPDAGPPPATFIIHNRDRYTLGLSFYSENYGGAWPGGNQQYILKRDGTYELNCSAGEKICFGAWRDYQSLYWGAGHGGHEACQNCCTTCGNTFETTLNDAGGDSYAQSGSQGSSVVNGILSGVLAGIGGFSSTYSGGGYRAPVRLPIPSGGQRPPQSTITGLGR